MNVPMWMDPPFDVLDYTVEARLGYGGMGIVFRARRRADDAAVALKFLHPHLVAEDVEVSRFLREAAIARQFDSDHLVRVLDSGQADGRPFIVMELLVGQPLHRILDVTGEMVLGDALRIGEQIADGLSHLHRAGVVHRDIKLSNIVVTRDKDCLRAKIVDFGIARAVHTVEQPLTKTGMILGTPAYIAPEIIAGEKASPASDVYAVGGVLFRLATGRRLFDNVDWSMLQRIHERGLPDPRSILPTLPQSVAELISQCLRTEPSKRPRDGSALRLRLQAVDVDEKALRRRPPLFSTGGADLLAPTIDAGDDDRERTRIDPNVVRKDWLSAPDTLAIRAEKGEPSHYGGDAKDMLQGIRSLPPHLASQVLDRIDPQIVTSLDKTLRNTWLKLHVSVALNNAVYSVLGDDGDLLWLDKIRDQLTTGFASKFTKSMIKLFSVTPVGFLRVLPAGWPMAFRNVTKPRITRTAVGKTEATATMTWHNAPRIYLEAPNAVREVGTSPGTAIILSDVDGFHQVRVDGKDIVVDLFWTPGTKWPTHRRPDPRMHRAPPTGVAGV